ncbi:MAG: hypothetical protein D6786_03870 [Gammaproteobacteria bacterium]|nr:MAG: hypothetical protein D6786_03870 [Gammaproteobacteria bacterium]
MSRGGGERSLASVPPALRWLLPAALVLQLSWHARHPLPAPQARELPPPPPPALLHLAAFGEEPVLARVLMLWLQFFDNQPGISLPFRTLDYHRLRQWLELILQLDPRSHYPLLAAIRLYALVPDPQRQRVMVDFVRREFPRDPARRWQWMAHAVFVARHRIGDLKLALALARELRLHTRPGEAPDWARQMEIFILADMGELEAAKVLLGGLLESGAVTDPGELEFLRHLLERLEERGRP